MSPTGFHWVIPPEKELIPNIEAYGEQMLVAMQAVATYWGQSVQNDSRLDADWMDRTANARGGLFFAVDGFGLDPIVGTVTPEATSQMSDVAIESGDANMLIVTLGHTVFYGKYLELSNGGKYAVIMSTIEANLPKLDRMLQDLFKG
jgi:hypothetical protein